MERNFLQDLAPDAGHGTYLVAGGEWKGYCFGSWDNARAECDVYGKFRPFGFLVVLHFFC